MCTDNHSAKWLVNETSIVALHEAQQRQILKLVGSINLFLSDSSASVNRYCFSGCTVLRYLLFYCMR